MSKLIFSLKRSFVAVTLITMVLVGTTIAVTPASAQAAATTEIASCTTITESGTYTLTTDVENSGAESCILVDASDVTFDGNGHTIDGVDADRTSGVELSFESNDVTIRDLTVTDWEVGLYSYASERATVSGLIADSNFVGLFFEEGSENTVTDTTAANNEGNGVSFFISDENTLRNVATSANGANGFSFTDSSVNTLRDVEATDNDGAGVAVEESGGNTIENAVVTDNTETAFASDSVLGQDPETNTAEDFAIDSATISFTESKDTSAFNHALTIGAVESAPDDPDGKANIGQYVEVTESAPNAAPSVAIGVQYDDADIENAGVDEASLRLYAYENGEWTEVLDSLVDTEANVVSGTVSDVDDETLVVAPLGQPADESGNEMPSDGGEDTDADEGDDGDSQNNDGAENDQQERNGNEGGADEQAGNDGDEQNDGDSEAEQSVDEAPKTDDGNGADEGDDEKGGDSSSSPTDGVDGDDRTDGDGDGNADGRPASDTEAPTSDDAEVPPSTDDGDDDRGTGFDALIGLFRELIAFLEGLVAALGANAGAN